MHLHLVLVGDGFPVPLYRPTLRISGDSGLPMTAPTMLCKPSTIMYITNNTRSLFAYWRCGVGDALLAENLACYLIVGTE